jgi:hypothetical protein
MAGRAVAAGAGGFVAGGPVGALLAVAASVVPDIVRSLAGDTAGTAAEAVADAVRVAAGTDDPIAAAAVLSSDPARALELRTRLLQIQVEAEAARRRDELEALRMSDADRQASRSTMMQLAGQQHPLAWMPALQTIAVGLAFMGSLIALFWLVFAGVNDVKPGMREILVMILGILAAEFRGACQYWIGGSRAGGLAAAAALSPHAPAPTAPAPTAPPAPEATAPRRGSIFSRSN